ncbi:MAG TPA: hypothetical protein VK469_18675 [Candidatus Kapabacteria bacterium]|nr:hypothetical protein [Candidatus Kapabacteria bacterium]
MKKITHWEKEKVGEGQKRKRKARDRLNEREGLSHRITHYPSRAFFTKS